MKRFFSTLLILLPILAFIVPAGPALAAGDTEQAAILGAAGEAYLLHEGRYVELFPDGDDAPAGSRVLALDVMRPGAAPERLLVPGTDGTNAERSAVLAYEDVAGTLYVLWQGWNGGEHVIKLARYSDGLWNDPLDLSGTPGTAKGTPQLVVTREAGLPVEARVETTEDELADQILGGVGPAPDRTILHVVWWEQAGYDAVQIHYRPLVVCEGDEELGPEVILNGLLEDTGVALPVSSSLARRPAVAAGPDPDSVIVSFADDATGLLANVELRMLPISLGLVGDSVRDDLTDNAHLMAPTALGDRIRAHIIETGRRMNPRDTGYLADVIRAHLIEIGQRHSPDVLGGLIRAHLIEIGARVTRERSQGAATPIRQAVLEMGDRMVHLIGVSQLHEQPLSAEAPTGGESWVFPSRDGMSLTLAWTDASSAQLFYQDSRDTGWGALQGLELSDELPLVQALELVQRRASNR